MKRFDKFLYKAQVVRAKVDCKSETPKMRNMNRITLCKKDACLTVKGEMADLVAFALVVAFIGYGISALTKALS